MVSSQFPKDQYAPPIVFIFHIVISHNHKLILGKSHSLLAHRKVEIDLTSIRQNYRISIPLSQQNTPNLAQKLAHCGSVCLKAKNILIVANLPIIQLLRLTLEAK